MTDAIGKEGSVLFAAEVQPPHLPGVAPLVEIGRGLVIFEPSSDWTVYDHLWKQRGRVYKGRASVTASRGGSVEKAPGSGSMC